MFPLLFRSWIWDIHVLMPIHVLIIMFVWSRRYAIRSAAQGLQILGSFLGRHIISCRVNFHVVEISMLVMFNSFHSLLSGRNELWCLVVVVVIIFQFHNFLNSVFAIALIYIFWRVYRVIKSLGSSLLNIALVFQSCNANPSLICGIQLQ